MTTDRVFLNSLGIVNPLGAGKDTVGHNLFDGDQEGMARQVRLISDKVVHAGTVTTALPPVPSRLAHLESRNNRLLLAALIQIEDDVMERITRYGRDRIAVIMGTSTSGIAEGEAAIAALRETKTLPDSFDYAQQELGSVSTFAAEYFGLTGPAYTISTACTSSAKAIASARRLIQLGLCDAAIAGGADSLCGLTLNGFDALDSLSPGICNPFSRNRAGVNIGEGAAVFLLSAEPGPVAIDGVGETSDAYHISAPDPDGAGAIAAMSQALDQANRSAADVAYVKLHGTGTALNDAMEAKAVSTVLGDTICCSSTKPMTGHMLGAAGANELAFAWLTLQPDYADGRLPPHLWDGERDPELAPITLVSIGNQASRGAACSALCNSFAFGGNNISVLLTGIP